MTASLRIGFVGAGGIARAMQIPTFQKNDKVQVVAIADVVQQAVDAAVVDFGIPHGYTDYREMFTKEELNAVVVCTPNKFHAPISIAALDQGLHVLCEKPMALNATEAAAMTRAARASGKILMIAYRYRQQAVARAAKTIIASGELGEIYMIRVNGLRRRGIPSWGVFTNKEMQGGGALVDYGVHLLDLALWLAGNPRPLEVSGITSRRLGTRPNVNPWGQWDYENFQVEDHAAAFIRFAGGTAMQLEVSWALNIADSSESISFSGTEGGLDVFPLKVYNAKHGMLGNWEPIWFPGKDQKDWDLQAADFVDAVIKGHEPTVKPEEAQRVSQIVDAIYASSECGAAVNIDQS
ncbi:MAG: Gfo/Idh/MocA family oxidoreductase [Herpetosiphonaceae bacterium]|nr:Gfo/Idh/MocA family oxidoreductase [Herpetosiphonaceae bacterium]